MVLASAWTGSPFPPHHSRMKLSLLALLLVVARVSGAQAPVPTAEATELARRLAGCYRLDDGAWRADSVRAGDVSTAGTPLFFELTDQLLRGVDPIQSSERPMFAVRESTGRFTYWQHVGSSTSIHISYPLPFAGISLTLAPDQQDLRGSVTAFTDAIVRGVPSEVTRPVYARRTACPPATRDADGSRPPPSAQR
jgi:hypothetical protein